MRFDTLADWLSWLESLHPKSIDLGLERLRRVADRLPELAALREGRQSRVVTVGGTNGKGSCVAVLEGLCLATGQTVGTYTSPHLLRYNERVRINGEPVADQALIEAFDRIDSAREEISLTYFEFGTLAALMIFAREGIDTLVLEVGLGGRLDAVNLLDCDVAVITSIDLDHQDWLGSNREAIAAEKAGIIRPGRPAICADSDPPRSLLNIAAEQGAHLLLAGRELSWSRAAGGWSWQGCSAQGKPLTFNDLPLPHLPLASVAAALQAFVLLGNTVDENRLARVLRECRLPGRCQRIDYRGRQIILDVAHNPAAANYLNERLLDTGSTGLRAVFAVMQDKDYRTMLETLGASVDEWYLCGLPELPRAAAPEELAGCARGLGLVARSCASVEAGFAQAMADSRPGDQILVAGSFYTVAAVLTRLNENGASNEPPEAKGL
ncbi:bifunctional tetrahydrofolate synthase/dihydrofolate synthase [Gilvimarinus sp. F26214L]|uniref:bifunctional tetrahydrofolate synthase/dihydrofolate synthase n=1 Tax=Gilvimarinus sp. DZF01 TaxID=3461371 RepID=UPI00404636D4